MWIQCVDVVGHISFGIAVMRLISAADIALQVVPSVWPTAMVISGTYACLWSSAGRADSHTSQLLVSHWTLTCLSLQSMSFQTPLFNAALQMSRQSPIQTQHWGILYFVTDIIHKGGNVGLPWKSQCCGMILCYVGGGICFQEDAFYFYDD